MNFPSKETPFVIQPDLSVLKSHNLGKKYNATQRARNVKEIASRKEKSCSILFHLISPLTTDHKFFSTYASPILNEAEPQSNLPDYWPSFLLPPFSTCPFSVTMRRTNRADVQTTSHSAIKLLQFVWNQLHSHLAP